MRVPDTCVTAPTRIERLHDALRASTRDQHRKLDHHPLLAPLVRPTLTLRDYAQALAALYAAQAVLEEILHGHISQTDFPPRLAALQLDLERLAQAPFPLSAPKPVISSAAERIGLMYVLEGSNLGGAMIQRQLSIHLPASCPRHFYGITDDPNRWERFWLFAQPVCSTADDIEQAVQAARRTFIFLCLHLDACLARCVQ